MVIAIAIDIATAIATAIAVAVATATAIAIAIAIVIAIAIATAITIIIAIAITGICTHSHVNGYMAINVTLGIAAAVPIAIAIAILIAPSSCVAPLSSRTSSPRTQPCNPQPCPVPTLISNPCTHQAAPGTAVAHQLDAFEGMLDSMPPAHGVRSSHWTALLGYWAPLLSSTVQFPSRMSIGSPESQPG